MIFDDGTNLGIDFGVPGVEGVVESDPFEDMRRFKEQQLIQSFLSDEDPYTYGGIPAAGGGMLDMEEYE